MASFPVTKKLAGVFAVLHEKDLDRLMFDRRLFHTPTPNWSSTTRKVCFVGYGFRWLKVSQDNAIIDCWLQTNNAIIDG